MNILVYPHELIIGGSQINAIELAAAVRDFGNSVVVTGPKGPLVEMIRDLGLDYEPTPTVSFYPAYNNCLHLMKLARQRQIDIIHCYEWRPSIEAAFGAHMLQRVPILMTVMSMSLTASLPHHLPLVVGTRQLADQASPRWETTVMEPPIDTNKNRAMNGREARSRWNIDDREFVISVICRLTHEHEKLEGVLCAIRTVRQLAWDLPVRFLVIGDGEGRAQVDRLAAAVNRLHGREVIIVAGAMLDPREGYDAADVVLGMGSSAMKAMAFSKPLVVQGTGNFWSLLDEDSLGLFLHQGWFGHGGAEADLEPILRGLAADPVRRAELGRFGRELVEQRFSLTGAAKQLSDLYQRTVARQAPLTKRLPSIANSAVDELKFMTVTGLRSVRRTLKGREA